MYKLSVYCYWLARIAIKQISAKALAERERERERETKRSLSFLRGREESGVLSLLLPFHSESSIPRSLVSDAW